MTSDTAIQTRSGHWFDLQDSESWTYDRADQIGDISHALSNICRYNGQVDFYSVAEHALRVSHMLGSEGHDPLTQLLGLHHDDCEAYITDVPAPQKRLFRWVSNVSAVEVTVSFKTLETFMEERIFDSLGLITRDFDKRWDAVKHADEAVFRLEWDERPFPRMRASRAMKPMTARREWLHRHGRLWAEWTGQLSSGWV